MNTSKRYYVGSEDGRSINFQKEEEVFRGSNITIKSWHICVIVAISGMVIGGGKYINTIDARWPSGTGRIATVNTSGMADDAKEYALIDENGFVFGDSSKQILSEAEVYALLDNDTPDFQRLVRMSINEIYARHGQAFESGGENDVYYQGYSWYGETNKHIVGWEEFNEAEKTNLRLLISIEEEYGYR